MRRYWALKTRILVLLLGGFAVPVIVLGFAFFLALMNGETKKRTEQHLTSHARATIRQVDALLDRAAAQTRAAAVDGMIVAALAADAPTADITTRTAEHLDDLVLRFGVFDLAVVIDADRRLVATNLRCPEPSLLRHERAGDLAGKVLIDEEEWVGPALRGEVDPGAGVVKVNWAPSGLADRLGTDVARDREDREDRFYIRYAAPVLAEGRVTGAVAFYLSWRHIQREIMDRSKRDLSEAFGSDSGYAFMFDRNGRTIIGHDRRRLYGSDLVDDHHLPSLHAAVVAGEAYHAYEFPAGQPKIAGLARSRSPAGFGWSIGTGVYNVFIYEGVKELGGAWALSVLALAVGTSLVAVRMTRRFRLSVDQLIQTAGRVARGEAPGTVTIDSRDEIGNLAEAFNEMAETLRKRFKSSDSVAKPFREIRPNPFIFGNPIRTREMFYGRRREFETAREALARAPGGLVLVFCGDRRSGKTSILFQLANGELGPGFATAFIDLQGHSAATSEEEFFDGIAAEIAEPVGNASAARFSAAGRTPAQAFREYMHAVVADLAPRRLVILFDEYEILDGLIDRGAVPAQVVPFLASFTEADPPVSFVFSGSHGLEAREGTRWGALVAKSQSIPIGLLSREDALALIEEPVAGLVEYDFGIPGGIVRLTGGHPYYTQVICQGLIDHLNRVRHNSCDARDLAAVVDEVIQNPPPQMVYFWKQRTPEERLVLSLLAETLPDDGASASAAELARAAADFGVAGRLDARLVARILHHFAAEDLLEEPEPGRYRWRIDLFRLRIKRAHSMWQVLREEQRTP